MKDLKDYRNKELKYYVLTNLVLLLLSTGLYVNLSNIVSGISLNVGGNESALMVKIVSDLIGLSVLSCVGYVYVFVLDAIISSELKYKICYLYFGKKPGCMIFSKMKTKDIDDRFTRDDIADKYKDIYIALEKIDNEAEKMNYENRMWYSIYSNYKDNNMIFSANRDYLLCRDLCVATILLVFAYIVVMVSTEASFDLKVFIYLFFEFVIADVAFWTKGKRLACNVITLDVHKNEA